MTPLAPTIPAAWIDCPECQGVTGCMQCEKCGGSGRIAERFRRSLSDTRKAWWASLTAEKRAAHLAKVAAAQAASKYRSGPSYGAVNNPWGRKGKPRASDAS